MGIQKAQKFCETEVKMVLAERTPPNHILHLLLSVVTIGLWLPVWLLISITTSSTYICPDCGEKTLGYVPRKYKKELKAKRTGKIESSRIIK